MHIQIAFMRKRHARRYLDLLVRSPSLFSGSGLDLVFLRAAAPPNGAEIRARKVDARKYKFGAARHARGSQPHLEGVG